MLERMTAFAICSSLYENGREYLEPFIEGVLEAASRIDKDDTVEAIFAIDNLDTPSKALANLSAELPAITVQSRVRSTPTEVRNAMLRAARASRAEILVFVDMDDVILPEALNLHRIALQSSEISYGELELIDRNGQLTGFRFFEGADVPDAVTDPDVVTRRNFFGLSNTAVRADCLTESVSTVPGELVATDWWMYTQMLSEGCSARRTEDAVVGYRQHAGNILGGNADIEYGSILKRCQIIRAHYAALKQTAARQAADREIARLADCLRARPCGLTAQIKAACSGPGVWYDDIFRLAALVENLPPFEDS
jgi:hypothetical protein